MRPGVLSHHHAHGERIVRGWSLSIGLEGRTSDATGLVTPLLKKPGLDAGDFKNFRPITNLMTLSKILERLALVKLKSHIVTSPNYCSLQSAYRAAHSTETALVKIVDEILTLVDSGSAVALVGLAISVAFDIVSHSKLLSRLEHDFGIEEAALLWIDSYLSNRTFFVRVGGSSSSVAESSSGVPQGSVLGPILFTAYVAQIGDREFRYNLPQIHRRHPTLHCTDCETGHMHQPPRSMLICTAAMVLEERPAFKSGEVEGVFFRHPAETSARHPVVVHQSRRMRC